MGGTPRTPNARYQVDERNLERQRLLAQFLEPFTTRILAGIQFPQNARCLDLGSGIGETTRLIASFLRGGGECVGLEQDPALVAAAERQSSGVPVRFQEGDATEIPFGDNTFHFVFARYLLMHIPKPERTIREMVRVVRSGGVVMLFEPDFSFQACHPHSWGYERIPHLLAALLPDAFIGRKLVHLLRAAGVREIQVEAASGIEHGEVTVRRTWRITIEAIGPALQSRNIISSSEFADLLAEFERVEHDPNTVLLHHSNVCVWGVR